MKHFNIIKKSWLVLLLLIGAGIPALAQPLSGVYTIGGTSPNYATLAAAVSDLNTRGVSGPVWFHIRPGTYTGTGTWAAQINTVTGASATNRIVFESENGLRTSVTISNSNLSTANYIFRLNNASFITIRNMTLEATSSTNGRVIEFAGTSSSDSVVNCSLTSATTTTTSNSAAVVYALGLTGSGNAIHNNTISNGSFGIHWYGTGTTSLTANNSISNNTITGQHHYGIRADFTSNLRVLNNTVTRSGNTTTYYGMFFNYGNDALRVHNNTVTVTATTSMIYGIQASYCQGSATVAAARGSFRNNTISLTTTSGTQYALNIINFNTFDTFANNTVTQSSTTGALYPVYNYWYNTDMVITGNTLNATCTSSGSIFNTPTWFCSNASFRNNAMNFTTSTGAMYPMFYAATNSASNNVISGNTVTGTVTSFGSVFAYHYALANTSSNNTISGNMMNFSMATSGARYAWNYSLHNNSTNNTVTNNVTNFTGGTGACWGLNFSFNLNASNNVMTGNTMTFTTSSTGFSYGMNSSFSSTANNNTFSGNTLSITNNSTGPLYAMNNSFFSNASNNVVSNNTLFNRTNGINYGLWNAFYNGANNCSFTNNNVTVTSVNSTCYASYYFGYNSTGMNIANNNFATSSGGTGTNWGHYFIGYLSHGLRMTNNTISSVSNTGSVYGVYWYGWGTNNVTFNKNTVTAVNSGGGICYGLYLYTFQGTGVAVNDNRILARSNTGTTYGMYLGYLSGGMIRNNAVSTRTSGTCYTLYDFNYNSFADTFYNNTFSNAGTGTNSYAAYFYPHPSFVEGTGSVIINNVFANMSTTTPPVWLAFHGAPMIMDYNNFYSRNTTNPNFNVLTTPFSSGGSPTGAWNLPQLRALPYGLNANSLAFNPGFIDSLNDLRPDPAKPESWSLNGRGVHIAGNNVDILGNPRVTTKPAGVPDLGAYEFTPASTPPLAIAVPATPAAGTTQYFFFGQDTVMTVNWPASPAPPADLTVRQYTGTRAPGLSALGSTYMHFYVDAQPQGTGSFTSASRIYFKDPWTGTIAKSASRMAQKDGASPWIAHPHGVSGTDPVRNFIFHSSLPNFGLLTGFDVSNNAGALAIVQPAPRFCAGTYTLVARIANLGNNTLNNVRVGWSVDGVPQTSLTHTTSIPTQVAGNNEVNVTLGSISFTNRAKLVKIWTFLPNNTIDPVAGDDTITLRWGPGLSGEYTVGGTNSDYATVGDAINDLTRFGVCGPVWFNIRDGNYAGQYNLPNNVQGMSAVNRVTFKSESGVATNVNLTSAGAFVFRLANASHYTLRNLSIATTNANAGFGIQLAGNIIKDTIDGCVITVSSALSTNNAPIHATSTTGSEIVIINNTLNNGYYGIFLNGKGTTAYSGIHIENNTILNAYYSSIYVYGGPGTIFRRNYINTTSSVGHHLYASYCGGKEISGNTFLHPNATFTSIYLWFSNGTAAAKNNIFNNVISIGNGSTTTPNGGIYCWYSAHTNVYNNSVRLEHATAPAASFFNTVSYDFNVVRNNVFANFGGGPAMTTVTPVGTNSYDYNNYYTTGSQVIRPNSGAGFDSLTLWRVATGQDRNSLSYDPGFISNTNLTPDPANPSSWSLNGRGVHIAANNRDMNGNPRVTDPVDGVPDIGAYEFVPASIPPVAKAIPATITAGGTQVFTFGQDTVARIVWNARTVVPSNLEVRQYTGTVPPAFPAGRHMYFYTDLSAVPVTYISDVDVYYKDPWIGKIPGTVEANLRMLRKQSKNEPWTAYNDTSSAVNTGRNIIGAAMLTGLGYFTGIENDSLFSANVKPMAPVVFCPGGSVTLTSGLSNSTHAHQWMLNGNNIPGANNPAYTATIGGDYAVRVTEHSNMRTVTSKGVAVTVVSSPSAFVTANGPVHICSGNTVTLSAQTGNGLTYQWVVNGVDIPNARSSSYTVSSGGNYTVKVSNIGCTNLSSPMKIIDGTLNLNLGSDTSFCTQQPIVLNAQNPGAKYRWSTGDTAQTMAISRYGKHIVSVEVDAGTNCIAKDTIEVEISPMPSVVGISSIRMAGNTYLFEPSGEKYVQNYLWILGDGNTDTSRKLTHQYNGGNYTLKLVVFNGCGSDTTEMQLPLTVKDVTSNSQFNLYPNPAQNNITLSVTGEAQFNDVSIVNSIGQIVWREQGTNTQKRTFDIGMLPDGHYLIRANMNDNKIVSMPFRIVR